MKQYGIIKIKGTPKAEVDHAQNYNFAKLALVLASGQQEMDQQKITSAKQN